MLGLRISLHSVKLIFRNFSGALRISSPLIAAFILFSLLGGASFQSILAGDFGNQGFVGTMLVGFAVYWGVAIWVAVAWHRFVLLEERSEKFLPTFHTKHNLRYFMGGFLMGILVIIVGLISGVLVGLLVGIAFGGLNSLASTTLITVLVSTICVWVFYRIAPILPAAALGYTLDIGEAWESTKPLSGAIIVLGVVLAIASSVLGLVVEFVFGFSAILLLAAQCFQAWLGLMVSVSVLTTIYGIAVEKRDL